MTQRTVASKPRPKAIRAVVLTVLMFALAGFGAAQAPLRIVHADWSSSRASAIVVAEALRSEGIAVQLLERPIDVAWQLVASGEADVLLSAWLPSTHAPYLELHGDAVVDLGPNLEGTRTGLAVPDIGGGRQVGGDGQRGVATTDVTAISDLAGRAEAYGYVIIGIEEEAGVMHQAREALEAYGLHRFELLATGSEDAMLARLAEAVRTGTPIVITAWVPLWANARWNLRFLDDPEGVFGGREAIHTVVRPGLAEDRPELLAFLERFSWEPAEMERVMVWMQDGSGLPGAAARRWLQANEARVATWFGR